MPLTAKVAALVLALPDVPSTAQILLAFGEAEKLGFERGQAEMRAQFTLIPMNPEHAAMPESDGPYGRVVLECGKVGNPISDPRQRQIRSLLMHFNWKTERASLLQALADIDVHGDVDHAFQMGTFYDYREQGWIAARVVAA